MGRRIARFLFATSAIALTAPGAAISQDLRGGRGFEAVPGVIRVAKTGNGGDVLGHGESFLALSRDSLAVQRMPGSFRVQVLDGSMDGLFEIFGVAECSVGEMMGFQVAPDSFDVVEFGRVFGQPFDIQPMVARRERGPCRLAGVDRPVVENDDGGFGVCSGPWAITDIERFQMRDEIGAALSARSRDDQLAAQPVESAHHGDLLRLSRRGHAQIGSAFGPGAGEIGMRQRLALVGEQQRDVARSRLFFA